jgi:hypothetical protein
MVQSGIRWYQEKIRELEINIKLEKELGKKIRENVERKKNTDQTMFNNRPV